MSRKKSPAQTGREMLSAWLDELPRRTKELAETTGVNTSTVWRWKHGRAHPSATARELLRRVVGIPCEAWPQEGES